MAELKKRSLVTPRTSDAWDTRGFPHGRPCLLRRGLRDPARDLGPEAGRLTCRSPRCGRNATEKPGHPVQGHGADLRSIRTGPAYGGSQRRPPGSAPQEGRGSRKAGPACGWTRRGGASVGGAGPP